MTLEELYLELHGDIIDARKRLMTDNLINRFIMKFPADPTMASLRDAIESQDVKAVFNAAHTLKGLAANLGFTELFTNASALTEQTRKCDCNPDPVLMSKVEESYNLVIGKLAEYSATNK